MHRTEGPGGGLSAFQAKREVALQGRQPRGPPLSMAVRPSGILLSGQIHTHSLADGACPVFRGAQAPGPGPVPLMSCLGCEAPPGSPEPHPSFPRTAGWQGPPPKLHEAPGDVALSKPGWPVPSSSPALPCRASFLPLAEGGAERWPCLHGAGRVVPAGPQDIPAGDPAQAPGGLLQPGVQGGSPSGAACTKGVQGCVCERTCTHAAEAYTCALPAVLRPPPPSPASFPLCPSPSCPPVTVQARGSAQPCLPSCLQSPHTGRSRCRSVRAKPGKSRTAQPKSWSKLAGPRSPSS